MEIFLLGWAFISFTFGLLIEIQYLAEGHYNTVKIKHVVYGTLFLPMTLVMLIILVIFYVTIWISETKVMRKISEIMDKEIKRKVK